VGRRLGKVPASPAEDRTGADWAIQAVNRAEFFGDSHFEEETTMNLHPRGEVEMEHPIKPTARKGLHRRHLFKARLMVAAGSVAMPRLLGGPAGEAKAIEKTDEAVLAPKYYPLCGFKPEIRNINGKVAVITGASRGLGRAIGKALMELGVVVFGTSRNPSGVLDPSAFPLLPLDIADPASVLAFPTSLGTIGHAEVDILVNNAGRYVAGEIIPQPSSNLEFYLSQRDLGLRTVYFGNMMLTNLMLPLMPIADYARIIFTISVASYSKGAGLPGGSGLDAYNSAKAALRGYANALGAAVSCG
jgi:NADP-dependent 3-hydroxy acid dehydrogenase YdfG